MYKIEEATEEQNTIDDLQSTRGPISTAIREIVWQELFPVQRDLENLKKVGIKTNLLSTDTPQAISTATITAINFVRKNDDTYNMWLSNTPDRVYIRVAGTYICGAYIEWAANTTGQRIVYLRKNGTSTIVSQSEVPVAAMDSPSMNIHVVETGLIKGDYLQTAVYQNSGGNLNITTAAMWVYRIPGSN